MAWRYCRLYFDMDPDAAFGIVSRPTFENALRAHFRKESGQADIETDPGWYALRNTVFAAGCRILETRSAAKGSKTDMMATQSWRYFANALSVHSDILYYRTSLMAVQALAAMVRLLSGSINLRSNHDIRLFSWRPSATPPSTTCYALLQCGSRYQKDSTASLLLGGILARKRYSRGACSGGPSMASSGSTRTDLGGH